MYRLSDYCYNLPQERIAQTPCQQRDGSRLLRLDRKSGDVTHHGFQDLVTLLNPDDLLVINNTRVVPARLMGKKTTGGVIEVMIVDYAAGLNCLAGNGYFQCDCLVRASKSPKIGAVLELGDEITARVQARKGGLFELKFSCAGDVVQAIKRHGQLPLPPYIHRTNGLEPGDETDYQTVYAANEGAVAAPTAGLHFTDTLMETLRAKGIEFCEITLHVGYGTFVPVRVDDIREHQIHRESFEISEAAAAAVNRAKKAGRRVVAVGTTSVRTLEYGADETGLIHPGSGVCDLFIYPGYRFKLIDAMITNFHLPESTLLMLVSAFAGKDPIFRAYGAAIQSNYRFFSYGDAMLID
ncbi:QueA [Desulforapulum autotrophicum HRM2]|uniref:S-adenosylmethionine:tRNA ribosyltransferase-isomerase n=1 Tax=Desulforapulum autotrophicum (strain ATCC 43914 / DSM 3382 / VKM B-1955 / HRM2) TaxID=177437 RepID=C0QKY3_DESAH|nr:tRNA preQ1(34) S-adenosylmethionine ribosyltransferase-isomerase QueA [Desulforapulum autotrophicum]ACN16223.1 QueA [Desulforapulum autotrophicum HRM2]